MSTTWSLRVAAFLILLLILQIGTTNALNSTNSRGNSTRTEAVSDSNSSRRAWRNHFLEMESLQLTPNAGKPRRLIGSSVPECGHTCGACSPCNIQIVSYECEEDFGSHAEACPLGYLCICHGKAFTIP